jgi:hypothetical protein
MPIKTALSFHLIPVKWLSSRKHTTNAGDNMEKKEPSCNVAVNVYECSYCGNQCGSSSKN